eukprot:ANDGO_02717.mRNA.1 hypothetical protein
MNSADQFEYDGIAFQRQLDAEEIHRDGHDDLIDPDGHNDDSVQELSYSEEGRPDIKAHKNELKRYSSNQFLPTVQRPKPLQASAIENYPVEFDVSALPDHAGKLQSPRNPSGNRAIPGSPSTYVRQEPFQTSQSIVQQTILEYSPSAVDEQSPRRHHGGLPVFENEHQRILNAVLHGSQDSPGDLTYDSIDSELDRQHSWNRKLQENKLSKVRERIVKEAVDSRESKPRKRVDAQRHHRRQSVDEEDDTDLDAISLDDDEEDDQGFQYGIRMHDSMEHHSGRPALSVKEAPVSRRDSSSLLVSSQQVPSKKSMVDASTVTFESYDSVAALESTLVMEIQQKKLLASKCTALESEFAARSTHIESLQDSLNSAMTSFKEYELKIRKKDEEVSSLSLQLDTIRGELGRAKEATQRAIEDLNDSLSKRNQLEYDNKDLASRSKADQTTMRQLIQENETLKKDLLQARKSMVQLEKENSLVQESILDLRQQIASKQSLVDQYRQSEEAAKRDFLQARQEITRQDQEVGSLRDAVNDLRIQLREALQKQKQAESDALRLQTQISAQHLDFVRGGNRTSNPSPEKPVPSVFPTGRSPSEEDFVPGEREVELFELMVKYYKKQQAIKKGMPAPGLQSGFDPIRQSSHPVQMSERPDVHERRTASPPPYARGVLQQPQKQATRQDAPQASADLRHSAGEPSEFRPRISERVFRLESQDAQGDRLRSSGSLSGPSHGSAILEESVLSIQEKLRREMQHAQLRQSGSASQPMQQQVLRLDSSVGDRERQNLLREEELKAAIRTSSPPMRHRYQASAVSMDDPVVIADDSGYSRQTSQIENSPMQPAPSRSPSRNLVPPLRLDQVADGNGPRAAQHDFSKKSAPVGNLDNRPFATDGSLQLSLETTSSIENELMSLNMQKEAREREYEKVIPMASKKIAARKRKQELEEELDQINKDISKLRMKLRSLDALHSF